MISIIVAITKDLVIGNKGKIPWHIPEDFKHFKETTTGHTVIMGEKTFDSMDKKLLPKRHNIVLTRDQNLKIDGSDVCTSPEDAIAKAKEYKKEIFIIGGAQIYKLFLPLADRLIISWVKKNYSGDTYFPRWDENEWAEENREIFNEFEVVTYIRK